MFTPVADQSHYYLLSASAAAPAAPTDSNRDLTIGIAPVQIPAYLQNNHIVVRQGTNEIQYSENRQWAEHLDKGIQRVLAADLAIITPGTKTITSAWQVSDVKAELHVSIQRFELDDTGDVTLECQWRIVSPGLNRSGHSLITKKGPPLTNNPSGAVGSLSAALADLSKDLAAALAAL